MSDNPEAREHVLPSERRFGLLFAFVFLLVGARLAYGSQLAAAIFVAGLALVFALAALVAPGLLRPLNKAWYLLGLLLGGVVRPIVLAVIFFLLITPVAVLTRLFGRDALRLRKRHVSSYWVSRDPTGPAPSSFKNQF